MPVWVKKPFTGECDTKDQDVNMKREKQHDPIECIEKYERNVENSI